MMQYHEIERRLLAAMRRLGPAILRHGLAIIFIWFGILKPLGLSPAQELVANTLPFLDPKVFVPLLGWWEVAIGICFLFRPLIRVGLVLLFLHLPGTFLPLVVLSEACFTRFPLGLTVEGQYIIKNLLIIGAAFVVGGTLEPWPPEKGAARDAS